MENNNQLVINIKEIGIPNNSNKKIFNKWSKEEKEYLLELYFNNELNDTINLLNLKFENNRSESSIKYKIMEIMYKELILDIQLPYLNNDNFEQEMLKHKEYIQQICNKYKLNYNIFIDYILTTKDNEERKNLNNHRKKWSENEEQSLYEEYIILKSSKLEIAKLHERSIIAIQFRIIKLAYDEFNDNLNEDNLDNILEKYSITQEDYNKHKIKIDSYIGKKNKNTINIIKEKIWTNKEENQLYEEYVNSNLEIKEVIEKHNRSEESILNRIIKIAYDEYNNLLGSLDGDKLENILEYISNKYRLDLDKFKEYINNNKNTNNKPENSGKRWSKEEDKELYIEYIDLNISYDDIAQNHKRTYNSIILRVQLLAYNELIDMEDNNDKIEFIINKYRLNHSDFVDFHKKQKYKNNKEDLDILKKEFKNHPTYKNMIIEAVSFYKNKEYISSSLINSYISNKYNVDEKFKDYIKIAKKLMVNNGYLIQRKYSYKLSDIKL